MDESHHSLLLTDRNGKNRKMHRALLQWGLAVMISDLDLSAMAPIRG